MHWNFYGNEADREDIERALQYIGKLIKAISDIVAQSNTELAEVIEQQ